MYRVNTPQRVRAMGSKARTRFLGASGLVALMTLFGCAPGSQPSSVTPSPTMVESVAPTVGPTVVESVAPTVGATAGTSPIAFRSDRYGYALQLPPGWYVRIEQAGVWTPSSIGYVGSGTDAFEEDYEGRGDILDFPGVTYGLYVSAFEPKYEPTLDEWTDQLADTMASGSSCQGAPDHESMTIDGEPARALVYDRKDCSHDHHVVVVGVMHGRLGYDVMWLAKAGEDDARRETFESILETFDWTT